MTTPNDPYAGQPSPEHGAPQPATSPQQPAYYGQAPYYGPPTPNPPSRGAWFAIGAASMFGFLVFAVGGFFTIVGILLGDDFEGSGDADGYEYYVDQKSVVDAVEVPCNRMMTAGDAIELFTTPVKAAVSVKAFAVEAQGIADAIDRADPNSDSKQWRDDWDKLSDNLETFAIDLKKDGNDAFLNTYTELGEAPIMVRMAYSSEANCEIPAVVFAMDTDNSDYYMEFSGY